mmetsp:Transcript_3131/g.3454  ORF Transcript_3131/g.3454 Transcript_3131/m.3454 type:complete len:111 (+) Transcript_3131:125-457(+)
MVLETMNAKKRRRGTAGTPKTTHVRVEPPPSWRNSNSRSRKKRVETVPPKTTTTSSLSENTQYTKTALKMFFIYFTFLNKLSTWQTITTIMIKSNIVGRTRHGFLMKTEF